MSSRRSLGNSAVGVVLVLLSGALFAHAVRTGASLWLAGSFACFVIVFLLVPRLKAHAIAHYLERKPGTLVIDDTGVARTYGGGREAVTWAELTAVKVMTTSEGPYAEDVYYVLIGEEGRACLVPLGLAESSDLLAELERRLPGLDNDKVIEAMSSTKDTSLTIWTRERT